MSLAEHYRKNFRLAWPVMIGQLGHVMVGLADSIMIGQLGTIPLAAGAFANSVFVVPMVFGIGMAYGLTTPVANADGEGQPQKARNYLKHGIILNTAVALLLLALLMGARFLFPFFGQEPAVATLATPYFQIISFSILPLMGFLTFKQFAEGLSDTRAAMLISVGANLLNIGLNYLLIYGYAGFPTLGLNGAGIATLIARILMVISMGWYLFRRPFFRAYVQGIRWRLWDGEAFRRLVQIGLPSGLQHVFEVSTFAFVAIMAGWLSAESLAAHQIAISLASVSYMAASGFGAAANVRVSNQLGAGQYRSMRQAGYSNFVMVLIFMALCGLGFYWGRYSLASFYSSDPAVLALAARLLVVAVAFQLFDGLQVAALGALRGLSETRLPTLIVLLSYWVLGLGAAYYLGFSQKLGAEGLWYGLALGLFSASLLLTWRFEYRSRQMLHRAKSPQ